ncbi:VanZ family protein [Pleomorphomonas sp. JP5]|uniref:VanZ family protein n=1 Tax=Pleomorphomonas sp. JP5 TaxID=2942998 RepID=UPI002043F569|nr:VanZ family protein [Pleomorphomonas sp. JP5]MCM5559158.1 VanZ family protein [Pleomorphomonas sp. JP5]
MDLERIGRRLFQMAGVISFVVIAVLSVLPGADRPHVFSSGNVEHVLAYAGAAFFASSLPTLRGWRVVLLLSAASLLFEGIQILIPGRGPGLDNWIASTLGAIVGLALGRAFVTVARTTLAIVSR